MPQLLARPDAEGFVLAGGRSSRMGKDKALVNFQGQPLIVTALAILRDTGMPASIAGASAPLDCCAAVVLDAGNGPLGGVCAGLTSAVAPAVVFLSVDLPLIPSGLLAFMLNHARITNAAVTIASINGYPQTFPAIVQRSALPALQIALQENKGGCFAGFQSAASQMGRALTILPAEMLVQAGQVVHPDGLQPNFWFLNMNRPEDIIRGELMLAAHRRVS